MENFQSEEALDSPELNEQQLARLRYEAGLMDGSINFEVKKRGAALICSHKEFYIRNYLLEKFGGKISERYWSNHKSSEILSALQYNRSIIKHTIFLRDDFSLFYAYVSAYNKFKNDSKQRAILFDLYERFKGERQLRPELIKFSDEHLIGLFDSGNGNFYCAEKNNGNAVRPIVKLTLPYYGYLLTLKEVLGGTTIQSVSNRGYSTCRWILTGAKARYLLKDKFIELSKFRQEEVESVVKQFNYDK